MYKTYTLKYEVCNRENKFIADQNSRAEHVRKTVQEAICSLNSMIADYEESVVCFCKAVASSHNSISWTYDRMNRIYTNSYTVWALEVQEYEQEGVEMVLQSTRTIEL